MGTQPTQNPNRAPTQKQPEKPRQNPKTPDDEQRKMEEDKPGMGEVKREDKPFRKPDGTEWKEGERVEQQKLDQTKQGDTAREQQREVNGGEPNDTPRIDKEGEKRH